MLREGLIGAWRGRPRQTFLIGLFGRCEQEAVVGVGEDDLARGQA